MVSTPMWQESETPSLDLPLVWTSEAERLLLLTGFLYVLDDSDDEYEVEVDDLEEDFDDL